MNEAVIVGGGIGGLAAAVALRRIGWQATVLERAPEFGEVGAGLTLLANGMRALGSLGLAEAIRAAGTVDASGGTRTASGRWISHVDGSEMARRLGTTAMGIHRATLHRILRDALPAESLIRATEVVGVNPATGTVSWRRSGQTGSTTADLVVGADGINSAIREAVWPGAARPVYQGSTAWRAVTADRWTGELVVAISWGPGAEFGMVPLGDGRVYWYGAVNAPAGERAADEWAAARAQFGGWHAPIPQLMAATDPAAVLRNDIYYLAPPLGSYVSDRVALVGDAAHAMTPNLGQGANQALEDAVVLAACLAGDTSTALTRYDAQRRPRTQSVARASGRIGRFGQRLTNPVAVVARNAAMRMTPPGVALKSMVSVIDWQPPPLPDRDVP